MIDYHCQCISLTRHSLLLRSLLLWERDNSLTLAVDVCIELFKPVVSLSEVWPCPGVLLSCPVLRSDPCTDGTSCLTFLMVLIFDGCTDDQSKDAGPMLFGRSLRELAPQLEDLCHLICTAIQT